MHRSRVAQRLNLEKEFLGGRKHWRGFSVRQDPSKGRTAHTKCGTYLLASSLAAALLNGIFEHPARGAPVIPNVLKNNIPAYLESFSAAF
jgi:hypothetical protein